DGDIRAKGALHTPDGAHCKAVDGAGKVTVDGQVEGNVSARDRVELTSKARKKGDLVAARLLVAEGASFNGHVTVGSDSAKIGKPTEPPAIETKPLNTQPAQPPPRLPEPAIAGARR